MTAPVGREVLLHNIPARRRVRDPEFVISGIRPKAPKPGLTRVLLGELVYIGHTQIFKASASTLAEASIEVCRRVNLALTSGVSKLIESYPQQRLTGGRAFWEAETGELIDDSRLVLVVLQDFEARYEKRLWPTAKQREAAVALGVSVDRIMEIDGPIFEVSCEVGLDIAPVGAKRAKGSIVLAP